MKTIKTIAAFAFFTTAFLTAYGDSFFLTFENDALLKAGDNDYTHGTCLEYRYEDLWRFKFGQNMYAPSDLSREDHIEGDRPYAGYMYGAVGREMFKDDTAPSPWTHYLEVDAGMIGPSARCKETQKLIHKWLGCRDPKGWDNQLHDEFTVNAQWWTKYNWYLCRYAAIVPRAGVMAGTVQDAAELGCDLKVGWNLRNDVGNGIIFSAPRERSWLDDLQAYAYIGGDCRYYLYNHILEGSLFNNKDDGLGVDIEPFVPEWRFGAVICFKGVFVHYYGVFREDEFRDQPNRPDYGGIVIGYVWR